MSANFWFATAKVLYFIELCKYAQKKIVIYAKKNINDD